MTGDPTRGAIVRRAVPADCDAVADAVRALARDTGATKVPQIGGELLAAEAFRPNPSVHLWVAEAEDRLVGMLIGVRTLSTWRGAIGLYVCDLWVEGSQRGARLGERLLAAAAREIADDGMSFMKLEVSPENAGVGRFYRRLGFGHAEGETLWVLEAPELRALAR